MYDDIKIKKMIDEQVKKVLPAYLSSEAFTDRKLTDTPTDALQVVSRRYVTLNGTSANRPTSSVIGQQYFDTTLAGGRGKTVTWNGIGFVDGTGTYV